MTEFTPLNTTCMSAQSAGEQQGQEEGAAFVAHSSTFRVQWHWLGTQRRDFLTRHSTKMSQDGSCIIRKDCEVPPMPVWGGTQRETQSVHTPHASIPRAKLPCWALLRREATKRMDLGILPWKWFRFSHRKTTPVGVGIYFSTMHCYMAIFLFHYPPVFLLW